MRMKIGLNEKEQKVLNAFPDRVEDGAKPMGISDLAEQCWKNMGMKPSSKGNSWVRNSLRKLVKLGLVEHTGGKSGLYFRTTLLLDDVVKEIARKKEEKNAEKVKRVETKKSKSKGFKIKEADEKPIDSSLSI